MVNKEEAPVPQIDPVEAHALLQKEKIQLVDLRDENERAICCIPGATHIPFAELELRLRELDHNKVVVFHCRGGGRATRAVRLLQGKGLESKNLTGGILAWIDQIDPSQKKY